MTHNTAALRLFTWRKSRLPSTAASASTTALCCPASLPPHLHMIRGWLTRRQTRSAVFWTHTSSSHSAAPSEVYLAWWRKGGETVWRLSPPLHPPPPPSLPWTCPWPHSSLCSPPSVPGQCRSQASVIFLGFCSISMGPLCFGASEVSGTSVNIYGFVFCAQQPHSLHCSSCHWTHSVSEDKNVHSFQGRFWLSLCQEV